MEAFRVSVAAGFAAENQRPVLVYRVYREGWRQNGRHRLPILRKSACARRL